MLAIGIPSDLTILCPDPTPAPAHAPIVASHVSSPPALASAIPSQVSPISAQAPVVPSQVFLVSAPWRPCLPRLSWGELSTRVARMVNVTKYGKV